MGKRRVRSWLKQNKIYNNLAVSTFSESSDASDNMENFLPPTPPTPVGPPTPPGYYKNKVNELFYQDLQYVSCSKRTKTNEAQQTDRNNTQPEFIFHEIDETMLVGDNSNPDDDHWARMYGLNRIGNRSSSRIVSLEEQKQMRIGHAVKPVEKGVLSEKCCEINGLNPNKPTVNFKSDIICGPDSATDKSTRKFSNPLKMQHSQFKLIHVSENDSAQRGRIDHFRDIDKNLVFGVLTGFFRSDSDVLYTVKKLKLRAF